MGIQLYFPTSEMRPACQREGIWQGIPRQRVQDEGSPKNKMEQHLGLRAINTFFLVITIE